MIDQVLTMASVDSAWIATKATTKNNFIIFGRVSTIIYTIEVYSNTG